MFLYESLIQNLHTLRSQILLRHLNFSHQFCMGGWHIIEGEDAVAEFEEEVRAKGDKGPEREDGDDFFLD